MTTKLAGPTTSFLPFNRGNHGAKGNPSHPSGHKTAYLWEEIWAWDGWMEILGRYCVGKKDKKQQLGSYLFPRYHQLDATRKLVAAILEEGVGSTSVSARRDAGSKNKYLIQHSAGSGKTNSIAWSAHFLAELHDAEQKKVFDSVLVISDRTVIDSQLQEAVFAFERTTGVVATIKGEGSSKSLELATALDGTKKIVVCTIQTFPFALAEVRRLAATEGKRFAVIADEAHSSQTGEAATKLKAVLSPEELAALRDGGEVSTEDLLAAQMTSRASDVGVTFVAFTATPKNKTLELFGRIPPGGTLPEAFHVYSMRQAIEEGFILDVLQNYTPYSLAFRLAHQDTDATLGQGSIRASEASGTVEPILDDVDRSAALKKIMGWVRLHPYNIAQKVEVVIEHYREHVAPLLGGTAKAMVVVASRIEAVRWQLAMQRYIARRGYTLGTLVAFSGEVIDADSSPDPFTEQSKSLNPGLKGRDIREAFAAPR